MNKRRITLKKTAVLFPGQGSQSVGMGLDFYQEYDSVREIFDMAEEITKINILHLIKRGPVLIYAPAIVWANTAHCMHQTSYQKKIPSDSFLKGGN
jgi:malonyl CoA-acyl carrier protein transacylase